MNTKQDKNCTIYRHVDFGRYYCACTKFILTWISPTWWNWFVNNNVVLSWFAWTNNIEIDTRPSDDRQMSLNQEVSRLIAYVVQFWFANLEARLEQVVQRGAKSNRIDERLTCHMFIVHLCVQCIPSCVHCHSHSNCQNKTIICKAQREDKSFRHCFSFGQEFCGFSDMWF